MSKTKIAIIQTHPIQHFCPQFASYNTIENVDLHVVFETNKGLEAYFDKQFNKEVKWQGLDLTKFPHSFLKNKETVSSTLDNLNPDVVVIYGYTKPVQKEALTWAKNNNKATFYISDTENNQKRNSFKQFLKRIFLKRFFKKIDVVMSVGDANEDFYKWCGVKEEKIVRMFFPINISEIDLVYKSKADNILKIRAKHCLSNDDLTISTVGKFVPWKSQSDIIELLLKLEKANINCTAFLLGSGPDEEDLRKKADKLNFNKVVFTGFVQPHEMMEYLSASDIYIHPAEREPHSLAISEAIYLGCPVILSNTCGSYGETDDVQPERNGFVYPLGDVDALMARVVQLHTDASMRKLYSDNSIEISRVNQSLAHGEALISAINLISKK